MTAEEIIEKLSLAPHPEGGFYRQTWVAENEGRPTGTCIYFLLKGDQKSHWHKVDATEIWLYHAGAPICLSIKYWARIYPAINSRKSSCQQTTGSRPEVWAIGHL